MDIIIEMYKDLGKLIRIKIKMKIKLEILKRTEKRDTGINKERKTNNDLDCLRNDQLNFSQIG